MASAHVQCMCALRAQGASQSKQAFILRIRCSEPNRQVTLRKVSSTDKTLKPVATTAAAPGASDWARRTQLDSWTSRTLQLHSSDAVPVHLDAAASAQRDYLS